MIIRCGENLYQALSQSNENLYSSSEYIPFDICLPSLPFIPLNQKEKYFRKPSTVLVQVSKENLLSFCALNEISRRIKTVLTFTHCNIHILPYASLSMWLKKKKNSQYGSIDNWQMAKGRFN